jgi:hypothetical protein
MDYVTIPGANAAPGAPRDWNPEIHGECGALPIRVHPSEALDGSVPVEYVESAWRPDAADLSALLYGGHVVLRVFGWQPPVALYVEPAARDDAEDECLEDEP